MKNALEFALRYLDEGFSVIPIKGLFYAGGDDPVRDSKTPLVPWMEYQRRRPTPDEVRDWFRRWPAANIAIITGRISGIVVVDFDSPESVLWAERNGFLRTRTVRTARGVHAYYRYPENLTVPTAVRIAGMKIDIRSDSGYVIAPPSIHADGTLYTWSGPEELACVPDLFLDVRRERTELRSLYTGVSEGLRNDSLARLCGSWVNDGLTLEECLEMARMWNERNSPPLPDREVERTVRSIFRRHSLSGRAPARYFYERNFLTLPVFTHSRERIHRPEKVVLSAATAEGERTWSIIPSVEYGLPGPFDESVFMAVAKMICERPKPITNPLDAGSLRNIARIIGHEVSGRTISAIRESLLRLSTVKIVSDRIFNDADAVRYITDIFGIFDRVIFRGEILDGDRTSASTYIFLNPVLLKNVNAGHFGEIDFDLYFSLRNTTARGIYRILSPLIARGDSRLTVPYTRVAQGLQLREESCLANIRVQLSRAHRELVSAGIFRRVTYAEEEGRILVRYHRGVCGFVGKTQSKAS